MRKKLAACITALLLLASLPLTSCGGDDENVLFFYNWMEFICPQVLELFTEEFGITVRVDTFVSNEHMHLSIRDGGGFDVVVPSEYMAERMIAEGLLHPLDFSRFENFHHIDEIFHNIPADPTMEFFIPYKWGTLGIMYDSSRVYEPITSWSALWDERYAGQIFMYDSIRDTFSVALSLLGYSINTRDIDELNRAVAILQDQMPLVRAYLTEPIKHAMINGEGILAVMYSGDALYTMTYNENFNYVVPVEGSNIWVNGLVVPASARNKEAAMLFIDFLCRPEIAAMNSMFSMYTTANRTALDPALGLIDEWLLNNPVFSPPYDVIERTTFHEDLGEFKAEYVRAFERVMIGR